MGCADSKPPKVHTQKQPLAPSKSTQLPASPPILNSPLDNPTYKNHVNNAHHAGKENYTTQNTNSEQNLPKSNLTDLQKNPVVTRPEVKEQDEKKEK